MYLLFFSLEKLPKSLLIPYTFHKEQMNYLIRLGEENKICVCIKFYCSGQQLQTVLRSTITKYEMLSCEEQTI